MNAQIETFSCGLIRVLGLLAFSTPYIIQIENLYTRRKTLITLITLIHGKPVMSDFKNLRKTGEMSL
jgi:hypothetical protein